MQGRELFRLSVLRTNSFLSVSLCKQWQLFMRYCYICKFVNIKTILKIRLLEWSAYYVLQWRGRSNNSYSYLHLGKVTTMIARRPILNIISRLLSTVSKTMEKHGVVPDVIDKAPVAKLEVRIHIRCIFHCVWVFVFQFHITFNRSITGINKLKV